MYFITILNSKIMVTWRHRLRFNTVGGQLCFYLWVPTGLSKATHGHIHVFYTRRLNKWMDAEGHGAGMHFQPPCRAVLYDCICFSLQDSMYPSPGAQLVKLPPGWHLAKGPPPSTHLVNWLVSSPEAAVPSKFSQKQTDSKESVPRSVSERKEMTKMS